MFIINDIMTSSAIFKVKMSVLYLCETIHLSQKPKLKDEVTEDCNMNNFTKIQKKQSKLLYGYTLTFVKEMKIS